MPLLLLALVALSQPRTLHPRVVVHDATVAIEADTLRGFTRRWEAELRRQPSSRSARFALASADRLSYRYTDAERRYAEVIGSTPPSGDSWAAAAALGIGMAYSQRGFTESAMPWLRRSIVESSRSGDTLTMVEAIAALANWRMRQEPVDSVLLTLDSLPSMIPETERRLAAIVLCRRGAALGRLRRAGSKDALRAGMRAAREAADVRVEASCALALRELFLQQGAFDSAGVVNRDLNPLLERSRDLAMLATAHQLRGFSLTLLGRFDLARRALNDAIVAGQRSGNELATGWARLNLANVDLKAGDLAQSLTGLRESQRAMSRVGDAYGLSSTRALTASLLADAGDLRGARREMDAVVAFGRATGRWQEVFGAYVGIARMFRQAGVTDSARHFLNAADVLNSRHGSAGWNTATRLERAALSLRGGDVTVARSLLDSLSRSFHQTQHLARYEVRAMQAEATARLGDVASAERHIFAAADEIDRWRASTPDSILRQSILTTADASFETDVAHAEVLAVLTREGRLASAVELAERRRVRELHDRIVRLGGAHETARRERPPAVGLDSARAMLDSASAILSYVASPRDAPSSLVVITRRGARGYLLDSGDSLSLLATRLHERIERGLDGDAVARDLGQRALQAAIGGLPSTVTRLIIIPDGGLHRVPFEALRLADGRHVAERFAVWQVPSIAVAAALRRSDRTTGDDGLVLAMGNPTFANAPVSRTGGAIADVFRGAGGLPPLPASAVEARRVARIGGGTGARLGADATEAFLKRAPLGGYRVLHLATHAVVDDWSLSRTALALAPGGGEDGFLTIAEVAGLRLDADLVVLSACRTAGGVLSRGDGIRGLATTFLEVGARGVLATRWSVDDRDAARFMARFYALAATGQSVGDALRDTRLFLLRAGFPPRVWAAFTLLGDGTIVLPLKRSR